MQLSASWQSLWADPVSVVQTSGADWHEETQALSDPWQIDRASPICGPIEAMKQLPQHVTAQLLHSRPSGASQVSPGCTIPLPQTTGVAWHCASQVLVPGGSQSSPGSTTRLPQVGT